MQADELRDELSQLAGEMEPFASDVRRVRRRVARSRTMFAALLVTAVAVPTGVLLARDNRDDVVAAAPKSVPATELSDPDVLIVADEQRIDELTSILDRSSDVIAYTRLGSGPTTAYLLLSGMLGACEGYRDGLVVDSVDGADVSALVGTNAATYAWDGLANPPLPPIDTELFMNVDATQAAVRAVETALSEDPRITDIDHVTKLEALEEFRELFKDEPALIESTTADALPESFRITLVDPDDVADIERAYSNFAQVDKTLTRRSVWTDEMLRGLGALCP